MPDELQELNAFVIGELKLGRAREVRDLAPGKLSRARLGSLDGQTDLEIVVKDRGEPPPAARLGVPVIAHFEADDLGRARRLNLRIVDTICVCPLTLRFFLSTAYSKISDPSSNDSLRVASARVCQARATSGISSISSRMPLLRPRTVGLFFQFLAENCSCV